MGNYTSRHHNVKGIQTSGIHRRQRGHYLEFIQDRLLFRKTLAACY